MPVGAAPPLGQRHAHRHRQAVAERAGRGLDAGIAVVGMTAEPAVRLAVAVEIVAREHAQLLQDHVLDHAAVSLGHQERVGRAAAGLAPHELVVDAVDDLGARIRRADVQCRDLLRHVEDAPAKLIAAPLRRADVDLLELRTH